MYFEGPDLSMYFERNMSDQAQTVADIFNIQLQAVCWQYSWREV